MDKFADIVHFIRGLYGQPEGVIPLHAPVFSGNEKKYVNECIDSTMVSSVGGFVDRFERQMAEFTGASYAVAAVNGTTALHLALLVAGVKSGEEVITQPLTFIATINAIKYLGADPVFVDVDPETLGLSPNNLRSFIEEHSTKGKDGCLYNKKTGRKITACVPMHTFGHPCRIDEIQEICSHYQLTLVEDAAESLGSYYKGRHTGTFGDLGVFSFNGNKTITSGGGGMIVTNDRQLAERARHLSTQAKVMHPWDYVHDAVGFNYRMPNINAALGVAQLEQMLLFLEQKRRIAETYKEFFDSLDISFMTEPHNARSNYWLNAIILDDRTERDEFLAYSNDRGVTTRPAWTLMSALPMFRECVHGNLDNAQNLEDRLVNIPSSATPL